MHGTNKKKTDKVVLDEGIWEVDIQLHAFVNSIQDERVVRLTPQALFSRRKRLRGPWSLLNALEERKIPTSARNSAKICRSLNLQPSRYADLTIPDPVVW